MTDPIELGVAGKISPQVAIARAILAGATRQAILARLNDCSGPAAGMMRGLVQACRVERVQDTAAAYGLGHVPASLQSLRAAYDRAVAVSPEAAVAAYSLGDPQILSDATAEIIAWLHWHRLLCPQAKVLDFGCGIGRIARAIAPWTGLVIGADISGGMLAEARHRIAGHANIELVQTGGAALPFASGSLDLVVAVDTFPYVMLAGLVDAAIGEIARVVRPGGAVVILNLSYRGLDADRIDAAGWCALHGLQVIENGSLPFRLWDAVAFLIRRAAG